MAHKNFRFPIKRGIKTVEQLCWNIEYTISTIEYSAKLFRDYERNKKKIERRRLDLVVNHPLRDLQMMFGWDSKGGKEKYRECFVYASPTIYRDIQCQTKGGSPQYLNDATIEHIVPVKIGVNYLRDRLLNGEVLPDSEFVRVIFGPIGLVTKTENALLREAGWSDEMPNTNPMSRYQEVGIDVCNLVTDANDAAIDSANFSWAQHYANLSTLPLFGGTATLKQVFEHFDDDWGRWSYG